ncbi:hypothetical protein TNCV_3863821 [Trichonephila clavipes]|nr:hypothetical protein TNCV_3863821 [Trichonephila clavipes]
MLPEGCASEINTTPNHVTGRRTSDDDNATVQQPLTKVCSKLESDRRADRSGDSSVNQMLPHVHRSSHHWRCKCLWFQSRFVMWLRDPILPCTQSTCHHGEWCNEVGTIGPAGPSFPPQSSDEQSRITVSWFRPTR